MNSAPVMENLSSSLWISKSLNTVSASNDGLCAFANFFEKRQVKEPSTATLITLWRQGAVASWLVRSSPDRAVRVRALAGDIVLCSWARHLTLTVPVSTQVYKWVPVICWGKPNKLWGSDLRWTTIQSRGSWNTPSRFMLQKQSWLQGFTMSAKMPKDGVKRHNFAYVWYKQINSSCMERKKIMQKLWKIRMFH